MEGWRERGRKGKDRGRRGRGREGERRQRESGDKRRERLIMMSSPSPLMEPRTCMKSCIGDVAFLG